MGLLTWIIVGIVFLAIIGLGVGTFFSGILQGAQKVSSNPVVSDAAAEAKQYMSNVIKAEANQIIDKTLKK